MMSNQLIYMNFIKQHRFQSVFMAKEKFYFWEEIIAIAPPIAMYFFGSSNIIQVISMWIFILTVGSIMYGFVSTTDGHHYTTTIHDGDEIKSLDFGKFQIGATMDRTESNMNSFLALALFGERKFLIDKPFSF